MNVEDGFGITVGTMGAGLRALRMGLRWRIWVGWAKLGGRSSRFGKIYCCFLAYKICTVPFGDGAITTLSGCTISFVTCIFQYQNGYA